MKRLIAMAAALFLGGCPETIQTYHMEACAKACQPNGVREVTSERCDCNVPSVHPAPAASPESHK